jgi:hypothetical protein
MSGLFVAIAATNNRAEELYRQGDALLRRFDKNAQIQPSLKMVTRPSFFKKAGDISVFGCYLL